MYPIARSIIVFFSISQKTNLFLNETCLDIEIRTMIYWILRTGLLSLQMQKNF